MSPSVVSGDGVLVADGGENLLNLEKLCDLGTWDELVVLGSRAGLAGVDGGELWETGVVLRRGTITFNGGKHAILS